MSHAIPLPFARPPYENELLSSWLGRVACVYGASWTTLYDELNTQNLPAVGDHGGTDQQFEFLALLTRVELETIKRLDLAHRFPGQPLRRFLCHPGTRTAVPDFCPACWRDDLECGRDNYFRIEWAVAGVSHCQVHGRRLWSQCLHCFDEFTPLASASAGAIRMVCGHCCRVMAELYQDKKARFEHRQSNRKVKSVEASILRSLHGTVGTLPFRIYEDLAFLFFANWLPASAPWVKTGLQRWQKPGIARLTPAMRNGRRLFDPSLAFPLATTNPYHRASLLRAAIAVVSNRQDIFIPGPGQVEIPACLSELFKEMDDPLREEMVFRANSWPANLRKRIRRIIDRPGIYDSEWSSDRGLGWAASKVRRELNGGAIPGYARL